MSENDTEREAPPLESFDPWKLHQPDDGIVYLYRSFVDGFWRVINDEDMALQEATGYPVGELVEHEEMGDYDDSECGELRAIYVPPAESDDSEEDDTEYHLTEALDHLRKAQSGGFDDDHVGESVNNAITETIVARERRSQDTRGERYA